MNLEQTMQQIGLSTSDGKATNQTRLQLDVAKRVFRVSELQKTPYQNIGPEDWAKRWLVSDTFTLAEIAPYQVAVPFVNRINQNRVQATLMASQDEIEPIVIDLNKQHIGRTESGYVPKVIVVDGKHRHRAQLMQGRDRILAWVGDRAMAELQQRERQVKRFVIAAATTEVVPQWSKLDGIAQIYAKSMESMGGPAGSSLGNGSGPPSKIMSQGARSSGQLEEPDPSDEKAKTDPSDAKQATDPSDRLQWKADDPQMYAPGSKFNPPVYKGVGNAPGSGVGPRITAGPIKVKKIVTAPKKR